MNKTTQKISYKKAAEILVRDYELDESDTDAVCKKLQRVCGKGTKLTQDRLESIAKQRTMLNYLAERSKNDRIKNLPEEVEAARQRGRQVRNKIWGTTTTIATDENGLVGTTPWTAELLRSEKALQMLRKIYEAVVGHKFDEEQFERDYRSLWQKQDDFEADLQIPADAFCEVSAAQVEEVRGVTERRLREEWRQLRERTY